MVISRYANFLENIVIDKTYMRLRHTFIITMLFVCLCAFGQQPKNVSIDRQLQNTSSRTLTNQQETILQLQAENNMMQKHLEKIEKEIELYRGDVRAKTSEMNTNMALWLSVLTIIMAVLGVVVPLILNRRNEQNIKKLLEDAKNEANLAKEQAKKSEEAFKSIQPQVDSVKEQVSAVTEQAQKAEEAAKDAKVSQLLAQAINEEDDLKAIDIYTQLIEQYPDSAVAYYNRGCLKGVLKNDLEDQLNDYNKAIELNPNFIEAFFNRGNTKIVMNDYAGAIADFDRVIEFAPNYGEAFCNRGSAKSMFGDKEGAMLDYNRAIELNPKYFAAYMSRGNLKYYWGDIKGAISDIEKAIDIVPNYPKTYESRAKCYRKMAELEQDKEKASEWIAKAEADEEKEAAIKAEIDARIEAHKKEW